MESPYSAIGTIKKHNRFSQHESNLFPNAFIKSEIVFDYDGENSGQRMNVFNMFLIPRISKIRLSQMDLISNYVVSITIPGIDRDIGSAFNNFNKTCSI